MAKLNGIIMERLLENEKVLTADYTKAISDAIYKTERQSALKLEKRIGDPKFIRMPGLVAGDGPKKDCKYESIEDFIRCTDKN